ncbi:endolytic transglycosylase MltG [Candidatus Formimonas warabiya]|uniref:Endolytic murein transglycosylase n=1 Tax=Formimonas warabiya TaxID=1761012 RepID=A0A3G1KNE3_FORW1|nr:endolytic transglycosylase MltG [Candidatus Formimonas warabiya]ATW23977.1 hypothetical protein DCMF_03500 [Candidatus Formimonas warabiya]
MAVRRGKKRRPKSGFPLAAVLVCVLIVLIFKDLTAPVTLSQSVTVSVPSQATTTMISQLLQDKQLIHSPWAFKMYAKMSGFEGKLRAGEYIFSGKVSLKDIEETMAKGNVIAQSFTIPEGYNIEQIADLLAEKGIADRDRFLHVADQGSFPYDYLPPPGTEHRLEGFLFPDTYKIVKGWSEEQIIEMMLKRFDQVFTPEWSKQAEKSKMTMQEVVTLASIIEREAKVPADRPVISSVFHNRLKQGMYLESCATVQYALGEVKEVLLYEDLKVDSPYNTYLHAGLPPGPIASPGEASLKAALYPAETNYYYFVAKQDGSHYFSKTLAEHNEAKRKYLK